MEMTFGACKWLVVVACVLIALHNIELLNGIVRRQRFQFEFNPYKYGASDGQQAFRRSPIRAFTRGDSSMSSSAADIGVTPRSFESWPTTRPLPCYQPEEDWQLATNIPTSEGILFLKTYKTGSSTCSGVSIRLARNIARRSNSTFELCKSRFDHAWASSLFYDRDPKRSFLWTIVREPSSRLVSQFFHFEVARHKVEPSDDNFREFIIHENMTEDYYLSSLSLSSYLKGQDDPFTAVNHIVQAYDFIGISERMNESLVVLAMLLNVPLADVLYLSAKSRGGWDDGGGRDQIICTYIWPSFVSEGMQEILDSELWLNKSYWDSIFYKAASISLDLTIDRLGRTKVAKNLKQFEHALAEAQKRCLKSTVFPCSESGTFVQENETDCLWKDSACGLDCLDQVASELGI